MLEVFSAGCGLVQSVLILRKRKENWLFYLLNIITLTVFSFRARLYGDVFENVVYLVFGLLGLTTWYSRKVADKVLGCDSRIRYCSGKERLFYLGMLMGISAVAYAVLSGTDDPQPFLDAVTTGMGFTATLGMALKRVESWAVWFVDDILMAVVYFRLPDAGFWLMLLNIIWVVLAVGTYVTWHKAARKGEVA